VRAVMTGTASQGKGVRREAESGGGDRQNPDATDRNRIQDRHGGVTRPRTGRPSSRPGKHAAKSLSENLMWVYNDMKRPD